MYPDAQRALRHPGPTCYAFTSAVLADAQRLTPGASCPEAQGLSCLKFRHETFVQVWAKERLRKILGTFGVDTHNVTGEMTGDA